MSQAHSDAINNTQTDRTDISQTHSDAINTSHTAQTCHRHTVMQSTTKTDQIRCANNRLGQTKASQFLTVLLEKRDWEYRLVVVLADKLNLN